MIFLLLIFQGVVYGAAPSAIDIYNRLHVLQPGASVKTAYDMLGSPQETNDTPPILLWRLAPDRVIIVFLCNDSIIIRDSVYIETYEQIEFARRRYEELKEEIYNILGLPFRETEMISVWFLKDSLYFTMDYAEVNYDNVGLRFNVTMSFFTSR